MFLLLKFILLVINLCPLVQGEDDCVIDLTSLTWSVIGSKGRMMVTSRLPTSVYAVLEEHNGLKERIGRNSGDEEDRWVSQWNWDFQTAVDLTNCTRENDLYIELDGVDTVSGVFFNGWSVGATDNMFRKYKFKIDPKFIGKDPHQIAVRFVAPIGTARANFERYFNSTGIKVPPTSQEPAFRGEWHVNFLRKMQASFGWDWGPAYPSAGIWKNIRLTSYIPKHMLKVKQLSGLPMLDTTTDKWTIYTEIICETPWAKETIIQQMGNKTLKLELSLNGESIGKYEIGVYEMLREFNSRERGSYHEFIIQKNVTIDQQVDLWWPLGSGLDKTKYKPTLYELKADLKYDFKGLEDIRHSVSRKIGFRTIEVIQDDVQAGGKTFYFKINSKPIFMRGSNWIPADILPERSQDPAKIKRLLLDAAEANMNALRVWGGGIYESEYFYDLADELGIFIWQDLMFACAMYPTNGDFIQSVEIEVEQQIQRLKAHPSILIWAGNNENEVALQHRWFAETQTKYSVYANDYRKLYVRTIKPIVERLDPSRIYVASSPSNMDESAKQGWLANNPADPAYGDVHYYDYSSDPWNPDNYPSARFVSEYGFQSWPVWESWVEVIDETSCLIYPLKDCVKRRQHHPAGDKEMISFISRHFKLPPKTQFRKLVLLSQYEQANAIKTETEFYRRNRQIDPSTGLGYTMGALYWQLNDVWVAPSWSSIDHSGRWKALHFYARKFFEPILLSLVKKGDEIEVHAVNDLVEESPELNVTLEIFRLNQPRNLLPLIVVVNRSLKLQPSSVKVVLKEQLTCELSPGLVARVFAEKADGSMFAENWLLMDPLSKVRNYDRPYIRVDSEKISDKVVKLTLTSDQIGPFVWLGPDRNNGRLQDNGFFMFQGKKEILFTLFEGQVMTKEDFKWKAFIAW